MAYRPRGHKEVDTIECGEHLLLHVRIYSTEFEESWLLGGNNN